MTLYVYLLSLNNILFLLSLLVLLNAILSYLLIYAYMLVCLFHQVVTMWYRAPELLLGQEKYTPQVDMWSVGCIMGEILLRRPLFDGRNETETLNKIFKLCGKFLCVWIF